MDATAGSLGYRDVDLTFYASLGPVRVKPLFGEPYLTGRSYLRIAVRVHNRTADKKISYKHLAGNVFSGVGLTDDRGNGYKVMDAGGGKIDGEADDESIYPDRFIDDMVVFEPPVDAARQLTLSIQPDRFGYSGGLFDEERIRVLMPVTMIRR